MKQTSVLARIAIAAVLLSVLVAGVALAQGNRRGFGMHSQWEDVQESEAEYLAHMIAHHQEAIEAATQLGSITERDEMRDLADSIISEQRAEIELMTAWLQEFHPDASADVEYERMMRSLEGLDPDEADRVFIEDMIPHHMMAVHNSNMLLHHGLVEHDEVAELARSIVDSQHAEMAQMSVWYREWFGGRPGFGPGPGMGSRGHMSRWDGFDRTDDERPAGPRGSMGMHGRRGRW